MNGKNDISNELRSLSELVATISRETPYRVADDYFMDLPDRVLLRVQTHHKPLTFSVPEGYFDRFAEELLARIKSSAVGAKSSVTGIQSSAAGAETVDQELGAISPPLVQLRLLETYRLPEGYFEEISPVLTIARELNPYTVPDEYFHQLPSNLIERASIEKLAKNQEEKKPAKVVSFGGRRTNWWKYSAAAVVAGLILTVGWLRLHVAGGTHPEDPHQVVTARLMKVSDQDLQKFLADQPQPVTPVQPLYIMAAPEFNDSDMRSLLGDVPDGELKQYMEEHGGANDIATN